MASARPEKTVGAGQTAEHAFYRVVDAQRDDLRFLRERWPDRTSPASLEALRRLRRRAAPGGDAEAAMEALFRTYGGSARVPAPVRRRLEGYVWEHLEGQPWPERDLAEDLETPAIVRKARRSRRAEAAG